MTLCINPRCNEPQNPENAQFCQNCQSALLLKQRYRATKVLGEGGFGKTYAASDLGTQNKVIKVLIDNSPKAVELFQRESEVLSQLNNPGIPRVEPNSYTVFHPANSSEPVHCLVMEKVEGMNLQDYLQQLRQPIDSDTAKRWLKELVLILQEVHERGILHRDIKPQNIIFRPDGKLALIDFGAVREGTGTQVATAVAGGGRTEVASHLVGGTSIVSAGYTAPEQMNGQAIKQSDFYSLARTFIYLLTAKEPSQITYDVHNDILQWRQYTSSLDADLANLLDIMQSPSVRQRPENTQEVLKKLSARETFNRSTVDRPKPSKAETIVKNTDYDSTVDRSKPLESENIIDRSTISKNEIFWSWFWSTLIGCILGYIALLITAFILSIFLATSSGASGGSQTEQMSNAFGKVFQTHWSSVLVWSVFGLTLGKTQWFVIRKRMPKATDWITANMVGYFIYGSLMAASGYMNFSPDVPTNPVLEIGIGFCGGGIIGLSQWIYCLRKNFSSSAWWIVLAITSSTIGSIMTVISPMGGLIVSLFIDTALTAWGMDRLFKQHLSSNK
jgi:serine/threonine protein kinase